MYLDRYDKYYKLKNVIRYNTTNRLTKESVAEHSFYVALIALKICEQYNIDKNTTNDCILKALLHDLPEMELNDITHDAKEKLNLRKLLETYELDYFKREFNNQYELMSTDNKIINTIVDLADAYSVVQYVHNEMNLGNKSDDIKNIYKEIDVRIYDLTERLENLLNETK